VFQFGNVCTGRHANVAGGGGGDGVDDGDGDDDDDEEVEEDDDDEAVEEDAVVDVVLLLLLSASTRSIIAVTQVGAVTAAVRVILVGTHGALSTLVRGRLSLFFFFFDLLEEEPCEAKCRRDLASAACSKGSLMEATVVVPVVVEMVVEEEDEASASASLFLRAALLDPGTCLLRAGAATTKEVFGNSTPCIFGLDLTWNTEERTYVLFNVCELRGHIGTGIGSNSTFVIIGRLPSSATMDTFYLTE
jgi:hypothetical protein